MGTAISASESDLSVHDIQSPHSHVPHTVLQRTHAIDIILQFREWINNSLLTITNWVLKMTPNATYSCAKRAICWFLRSPLFSFCPRGLDGARHSGLGCCQWLTSVTGFILLSVCHAWVTIRCSYHRTAIKYTATLSIVHTKHHQALRSICRPSLVPTTTEYQACSLRIGYAIVWRSIHSLTRV